MSCNCGGSSSLCLATGPKGDTGDTGATGAAGAAATDLKGTMLSLTSTVMDLALTGTYQTVTSQTYTVLAANNGDTLYIRAGIIGSGLKEGEITYSIAVGGSTVSVEPSIGVNESAADTFNASFAIGGSVSYSYACTTGDVITLQAKRNATSTTGNATFGELFIQVV
jgi:hypothetical protein